jgi:hypothetical protein
MPKARAVLTALQVSAALALTACNRQPESASQPTQPDTVVTSQSNGKAIPNPHKTTPEPRSTYKQ